MALPHRYLRHIPRRAFLRNGLLLLLAGLFVGYHVLFVSEVADWTPASSRNLSHYVRPERNTTLVFPRVLHEDLGAGTDVLVLVHSAPAKQHERMWIRRSWMLDAMASGRVRVVFFVGGASRVADDDLGPGETKQDVLERRHRLVKDEAREYGDVLIEDFVDSYNNLTVKSVMMLKFLSVYAGTAAASRAPGGEFFVDEDRGRWNVTYILKLDDDVYLNVPMLLSAIADTEARSATSTSSGPARSRDHAWFDSPADEVDYNEALVPMSQLMLGHYYQFGRPIRTTSVFSEFRKWICPAWMYSRNRFPRYLSGAGYLFSASQVPCLYSEALRTPLIHLEDIFISGMLASQCDIRRQNLGLMHTFRESMCELNNTVILAHYIRGEEKLKVRQMLKDPVSFADKNC